MDELIPKYKIGDVVQLNSGGYYLTINKIKHHNNAENYIKRFMGYYECCVTNEDAKIVQCLELHEDALILIKHIDLAT